MCCVVSGLAAVIFSDHVEQKLNFFAFLMAYHTSKVAASYFAIEQDSCALLLLLGMHGTVVGRDYLLLDRVIEWVRTVWYDNVRVVTPQSPLQRHFGDGVRQAAPAK